MYIKEMAEAQRYHNFVDNGFSITLSPSVMEL